MARHRAPRAASPLRRQRNAAVACGVAMLTTFGCTVTPSDDDAPPAPAQPNATSEGETKPYVVTERPGPAGFDFESDAYEVWARSGAADETDVPPEAGGEEPAAAGSPSPLAAVRSHTSPLTSAVPTPPPAPSQGTHPAPASPATPATTPVTSPTTPPPIAPTTPPPATSLAILGRIGAQIAAAEAASTIPAGTTQALSAKLDEATAALTRGTGTISACGSLGALLALISAQYDKDIPAALADSLAAETVRVTGLLACP